MSASERLSNSAALRPEECCAPTGAGILRHDVERARFGIQGEALPLSASLATKAEFASGAERQSEYLFELGFIAVPPDPDACVVLRAKDLLDLHCCAPIGFDFLDHGRKPFRHFPGFLTPLLRVVISEAEGCHAPLAFERAELECDQGKSTYPLDQIMLYWRRDNAGIVSETLRTNRFRRKQRQLLIHDPALYPALR